MFCFPFLNEALEKAPALINSSPYGDGWIFKVKLSDKVDKKLHFQTIFFSNLNNLLEWDNLIQGKLIFSLKYCCAGKTFKVALIRF
jgi:hypothetical protein